MKIISKLLRRLAIIGGKNSQNLGKEQERFMKERSLEAILTV